MPGDARGGVGQPRAFGNLVFEGFSMRTAVGCLVVLLGSFAAGAAKDDRSKVKDLDRLQGTWKVESEVIEGTKTPAKLLANTSITFKDDTLIWKSKADNRPIKFKLDQGKKPPAIDLIDGKKV